MSAHPQALVDGIVFAVDGQDGDIAFAGCGGEDFSGADWVLPSLGSPERPLVGPAAELVGGPLLGIHAMDRLLESMGACG